MKEYKLLENDCEYQDGRGGMLIETKEVEQVVCFFEESFLRIETSTNLTVELINKLDAEFDLDIGRSDLYEDETKQILKEWLSNYIDVLEISNIQDYEYIKSNVLLFDGKVFIDLETCETVNHYEYHDGSNLRSVGWEYDTDLIVSDDGYSLDECVGNNEYNSGARFYHENVRKILSVDGDNVVDTFLIVQSTQWQGDHETGVTVTRDELIAYIEKLGDRDVVEYMKQIDSLK